MNYLIKGMTLLASVALFVSCSKDDDPQNPPILVNTDGFTKGVFVLSEGNYAGETGKLGFISPDGSFADSIYRKANSTNVTTPVTRRLGNVMQDLFLADGKVYMIAQNGERTMDGKTVFENSGMLFVCDQRTLGVERTYLSTDLKELQMPTNLAVVGNQIYIRDDKGIYVLDRTTGALTFVDGTEGAQSTRMAVVGTAVFALTNGSKILSLINGRVAGEKQLDVKPNGIVRSYDQKLWVSTTKSQILKVTPALEVEETHTLEGSKGVSRGWGSSSGFAASRDTLYFSNADFDLYRHIYSQNKTEKIADIKSFAPRGTQYYNSVAVDPASGLVYFATAEYGPSYLVDNTILALDPKTNYQVAHRYDSQTAFPAGIYATASF